MNKEVFIPPFPDLYYYGFYWNGRVTLRTWAGFRDSPDFWRPDRVSAASDGSAYLYVAALKGEDVPPSPAQSAAYQYLLEHEETVFSSVIQAIFDDYPSRRHDYGYDGEMGDDAGAMPDISEPEQLKMLIGLEAVVVLEAVKRGVAYIRFDLAAAWDPEHGFNVTVHQDRVVKVGETGAGEYHAEDDAAIE